MKHLRRLLLITCILFGACTPAAGVFLRVISPNTSELVPIVATSALNAGFEPYKQCDGPLDIYCAAFSSEERKSPLFISIALREGNYSLSATRPISNRLSQNQRKALLSLVDGLKDKGVVLCLDENLGGSGLPRKLVTWLRGNCT
jgi:hypothetical protein